MKLPKILLGAVAALVLVLAVYSHGTITAQESQPMLLEVSSEPLKVIRGAQTVAEFDVEIADDATERGRGLMFRTELPPNRAMLFVFENERPVQFWMRNTPRPLDILFVSSDGEIRTIARDTVPFTDTPIPSGVPVRYVLEVNAGIVDYLRLAPGDRLSHPIIGGEDG
jgi:uncharacterized membrane protein (UPF0127 family)